MVSLAGRTPRERHAPKMPMTHTKLVSESEIAAAAEKKPVQKKKAADSPLQVGDAATGSNLPKPWEALFPRPPARDLTPLVYQVWNKIKKELAVEMERRSGGF